MPNSNNNNTVKYSATDVAIVNALKSAPEGLTVSEIASATGLDIKSGHIVSAMRPNKGLIAKIGERTIEKPGKRSVGTYTFVSADHMTNAKDGKPFEYTDKADNILKTASAMEGSFTIAQLSEALGEKVYSGSITSLVKRGNLAKGEATEVATVEKSKVGVYGFVKDIPADAAIAD